MTNRERLLEILKDPIYPHENVDPLEAVADYLLGNGVTFQKWISVSKRAPKCPCLIFDANMNTPSVADGIIKITDEKHGTWFCDIKLHYWTHGKEKFVSYDNRITHWMPLPNPPEGGLHDAGT